MDDKTLFIIVAGINMAMWWLVMDFIMKTKRYIIKSEQRTSEYLVKNANYWQFAVENIGKMVDMNMNSLQHFSEQITDIMKSEGVKDAAENRQ